MYALATTSHHDETQFHSFVQLRNMLDPLPQFIMLLRIFNFHQSRCVCALMYEAKSMSKNPPWTSAIAASNRKYRLYQVYQVYRLKSVRAVPSVPSVPSELYLTNHC